MHDYEAQRRLEELVDKATSRRRDHLEPSFLKDIKGVCKASDGNVCIAYELLQDRLRQPHSQVRLLALLVCGELFHRSRVFRALLAARFSTFLELVVGFRMEAPLPAPAAAASALRAKALELVESWASAHGSRYPQIASGYSYLKDTLRFEFPEVDARRAAAEAAEEARRERAQQVVQERYQQLLESWPQQAAEARSLLRQMSEVFDILEEAERHQGSATREVQQQQQEEGGDAGVAWEDVGADPAEEEGLAAYAPDAGPADEGPVSFTSPGWAILPPSAASNDALVEALEGLHKLVESQALPGVQEALRVLVRAEVGEPGGAQHVQRERVLRAATQLRTQLAAAEQRYAAAAVDLAALVQAQQRRVRRQEEEALMVDLFGASDNEEEGQLPPPAGPSRQGGQPHHTPHTRIRDPAAPRSRPFHTAPRGATPAPTQRSAPAPNSGNSGRLSEQVRKALAAQAPVLPAGPYVHVWDSEDAPRYMGGHAMEISNHWGPVDVHQELPTERLDELFMVSAAHRAGAPGQRPLGQQQAPGRVPGRRSTAGPQDPQAPANPAGPSVSALLGTGHGGGDRRAQRAAERAYNDAVIAGVNSDEQLARALQDAEAGGAQGSKKRPASKLSTRDRLRQKLLTGRAVAAAVADAGHAERERHRDIASNRWENK